MYGQLCLKLRAALRSAVKYARRVVTLSKLSVVSISLIATSFIPLITFTGTAHADVSCSPDSVNLYGTASNWLSGQAVNVCSADEGSTNVCVPVSGAPADPTHGCAAGNVWSGTEWQCVELVNRLYLTKGWTTSTWVGNGNTLVNKVPGGLTEQDNGSISYVNPGDVITLNYGSYGHAAIINTIDSNGEVHIVNQNTTVSNMYSSASIASGSFSGNNASYNMNAWLVLLP